MKKHSVKEAENTHIRKRTCDRECAGMFCACGQVNTSVWCLNPNACLWKTSLDTLHMKHLVCMSSSIAPFSSLSSPKVSTRQEMP